MKLKFTETGWADYLYWQETDKRMLRRINRMIEDIERNGYSGIGKPEGLKRELSGWWSRRIDEENRLVYRITEDGTAAEIAQCKGHYNG